MSGVENLAKFGLFLTLAFAIPGMIYVGFMAIYFEDITKIYLEGARARVEGRVNVSMKIFGICGSMRSKSNSEWMLRNVLESAKSEKVETDMVLLRELKIKYCTGCDICFKNGGKCVIDDDMQKIYSKLLNADVIIVSSPNYFKNVSALTKNFIDRTNAFVRIKPRKLREKFAVGLCVGGEELEDTQHCEDALVRFFEGHRMIILSMVKAKADEPGSIYQNVKLQKKLVSIGNKISKGDWEEMLKFR